MATTTLQPSGQPKIVSVSVTGAGTLNGATSDGLDSSYIFGTQDLSYCRLSFPTFTLGANRVKQARLRVRAASTANGDLQTTQVRLRDPVSGATIAPFVCQKGFTTITVQAGGYETNYPGNIEWTQVRLDRLEMEAWWYASPAGAFQRVYELYVDIDTNSVPTVSGVTATGAATTTRPVITWSFSDADGDIQTRWWVKIFSSAQYGAGSFNPETSKSTTGTGSRFGDDETWTPTKDLTNGLTYKAYVKVAQDWAGPEGDLWWSDWVASSAFTIAVNPPPTPTLTATPDPVLPGYRMLFNVVAPVNLATAEQAALEGGTTAGWTALTNANITNSTATAAEGTHSLQLSSVASGTMSAEWSTRPAVLPGATYSATASVRSAVSVRTCSTGIRFYDDAGVLIGATNFGTGVSSATGSYTAATVTVAAPATAFTASVVVQVASTGGAAEVHRWDKIGLQAGSTTTWSNGGVQASTTVVIERLLKVLTDRAVPGNWCHPQIASAGGLTMGTDGFFTRQTSTLSSQPLDGPHPASTAAAGARMIVWRPLVGAANGLDFGLPNGVSTDDDPPPYLMPAVPGRTQTLSAWVKGSAAVGARIVAVAVDANNGAITTTNGATVTLSTSAWTRYTVTVTPGAGACYLRGLIELPSSSVDLDVQVTGIQYELGPAASAYVPGTGQGFADWEPVRALESTAPTSPGEVYRAFDHEVPPGDPVLYRARTMIGEVASPNTAPLGLLMDPPARNLLSDPFQPENAMIVNIARDWSETQSADTTIFHPLGRDQIGNGTADPIQVRDWLGGQDGDYTLSVLSEVELYRLRQLIGSNRPLLLRFSEGGVKYVLVAEDRGTARSVPNLYRIGVKTLQCARPT